jgi:hypothetical protein
LDENVLDFYNHQDENASKLYFLNPRDAFPNILPFVSLTELTEKCHSVSLQSICGFENIRRIWYVRSMTRAIRDNPYQDI